MWLRLAVALGLGAVLAFVIWLAIPEPQDSLPPALQVPGISDADRVSAMLSVHANARNLELAIEFLPELDEKGGAIDALRRDQGEAASSRRRRAVAKLAGYGLTLQEGRLENRFAPQIDRLGVDPDFISAEVSKRFPMGLPGPLALELFVGDLLAFMTPFCRWVQATGKVGGNTPDIEWSYDVAVPRRFHDVARALDPQSWNQCSLLLHHSYLVANPGDCCSTDPSDCPQGPVPPPGTPIPRGKPYSACALFEEYCQDQQGDCTRCDNASCEVDFRNVLCISTSYDRLVLWQKMAASANRYEVKFGLGRWIHTEWADEAVGDEIAEDSGLLWVERIPGPGPPSAKVHVEKKLRFKDPVVTELVRELVKAYEDELAGEIVEHACCEVAPETWGPFPWP
jgi:hypothetical protein